MSRSKSGWFVTSGQKSQSKVKITIYTTLYLTKWNCHGVQFFSMGFSDTSLCKICPNDHPGKVSSIVRVTLIGSELLFFDSIDVKLAQCTKMKIKVQYFLLVLKAICFVNSVCTIFSLWKQDPCAELNRLYNYFTRTKTTWKHY